MSEPTKESIRDQMVAEVEFVNDRLDQIRARISAESADVRARFDERAAQVSDRAEKLASSTKEWMAVKIGTASAVEDLGDAIDAIEVDLDVAEETDANAYRSALDRQLRVWRSRADRLRVHEALAEMEVREDLANVSGRLIAARTRALTELRRTRHDAKGTMADLREDLEELMADARHVIERAADAIVRRDDD
ncbi:MAG: hypothetical protein ACI9C1_000502 [Candidatus Aldehydirespiratoraceae bacterium]|jgi:ElaB/YqjD/DUF883 family membrane-anchored ribosome-binding protein